MQKSIKSARPSFSPVLDTLENRLVPANLTQVFDSVVQTTPINTHAIQIIGGAKVERSVVVTDTESYHVERASDSNEDGYTRSYETRLSDVRESTSWTRIDYRNGAGSYYSVTVTKDVGASDGNSLDVSFSGASSEYTHSESYVSTTVYTYSSTWDGRGNFTAINSFSRHYVDQYNSDYENEYTDGSTHYGKNGGESVQDVTETTITVGFANGNVRESMAGSSKLSFASNTAYGGEYLDGSWYQGASVRTDTSVGNSSRLMTSQRGISVDVSVNHVIGVIMKNESFSMYTAGDGYYQSHTIAQGIGEDRLTRRTLITMPTGATIDLQSSIVSVVGRTTVSTVDIDANGSIFVGTGVQTFSAKIAAQDLSMTNASGRTTFYFHSILVTPKVTTKTSVSGSVAPGGVSLALQAKDHVLSLYGSPLDQYTQGLSNAIFA